MNKEQIKVLQLMCNLEIAFITMKWYASEEAELPDNERLIALSLAVASTGELLHSFLNLYSENDSENELKLLPEIKDYWNFLKSGEVNEFKNKVLKLIRDKSAYHIDQLIIKNFLKRENIDFSQIPIWEENEQGKILYSPLATEILGYQLLEVGLDNAGTAIMTNKIYNATKNVIFALLKENFHLNEFK